MITAILAFLPALIGLIGSILARKWAKDTPQARHDHTTAQINSEIAVGDSGAVNARIDTALDRLQNASRRDPERSSGGQG